MKRSRLMAAAMAAALAAAPLAGTLAAQAPTVSEKKDVAIFALGYYGWAIPQETLGSIDQEIQKVFVDLGRFNILGYAERFSSGGLQDFIATLKKAKEANFVMPEKFQFGEALFTEAEFNKLLGAFIVAVPVVSEFNSAYNNRTTKWETSIKTNVTFIDLAAGGSTIGVAEVKSTGTDESNQLKSISEAIEGIPMQLQYEIRKIPAFQINTRVLTVSGAEIKLQLGQNMGIKKGDEYSVIVGGMVEGFKDERETGLVQIKNVGAEVSTGQVVYSSTKITKDVQLREIPRLGMDAEPYFHMIKGENTTFVPGMRMVVSRGFYGFRPYVGVQVPVGQIWSAFTVLVVPVSVVFGGEYEAHLGRLTATPYGGVGASYLYVSEAISELSEETNIFPHVGAQAYLNLSYLVTRNMRIYAEAGAEYWLAIHSFFSDYGGLGAGAGVAFKL
jgi:hypothetical protein